MFGLFGKKNPLQKLEKQHKKVLEEAFIRSKTDRSAGDALYAQAAEIEQQMEQLRQAES